MSTVLPHPFRAALQQHAGVRVFPPEVKNQSREESLHETQAFLACFLCAEEMPIAQEAPVYGLSELSLFAEETILNPGNRNNMMQPIRQ